MNKMDPRTEPWGIPQVIGADEKKRFPDLTDRDLSFRQEVNHWRALPWRQPDAQDSSGE